MTPGEIINASKASQDKQEFLFLYDKVKGYSPKVIVEIGTWMGYSMETLHKLFTPEVLITIESSEKIQSALFQRVSRGDFKDLVPAPIAIKGISYDGETLGNVRFLLKDRPIDFLFIDGDHHYETVKKDFQTYLPIMSDNSVIAFHDTGFSGKNRDGHSWEDLGVQVNRFWQEIKKDFVTEEFRTSDNSPGIGILYVDAARQKNYIKNLL